MHTAHKIEHVDFWRDFALAKTPYEWVEQAKNTRNVLLLDHAHCEKKAARFALQLLQSYPDNQNLIRAMTQLAREELLHFRQVLDAMDARNIRFTNLASCGYARALHHATPIVEPLRCVTLLVIGALIEARSSERFLLLSQAFDVLDPPLAKYYRFLAKAESRHYLSYVRLAGELCSWQELYRVIQAICEKEQKFFAKPSKALRIHSAPCI